MRPLKTIVADKGYHSTEVLQTLSNDYHLQPCISEPDRGRRKWENREDEKKLVYDNRKKIKSAVGKALHRKRGELVERSFAHCYETGGLRRTHLRGHEEIHKRTLIHAAACNLGLLARKLCGAGTPKQYKALKTALIFAFLRLTRAIAHGVTKIFHRQRPYWLTLAVA